MQTAATDVLVGRKLEGRYRILDRIARGGMSTVYAAVDERLDRLVAVKVMSASLSSDPAFTDRFAREARAAARLTHLNAVSVYDQGNDVARDGHHVFLVMELVTGRTLRELIQDRGRLSVAEAVSIMEPVLSALAAAHRAGLVHRDVKPENILLSDDGVVKVADFGLAHAVETDPSSTRTGLMMGTVAYCAPEQIARGETDPRSDVYSAGIVLFELLTGRPPYSGETAMNVAYQHVHSRVPAPSSRLKPAGSVPHEIDELVVAATDSDPSGRPVDAAAFLGELADVRAELGLPVTPVPARTRPRNTRDEYWARAHAAEAATTSAVDGGNHDTVVVGSDPAHGSTSRIDERGRHAAPRREDDPPPPVVIKPPSEATSRKRRRRRALIGLLAVLVVGLGAFFGGKAIIEWRFAHVPEIDGQSVAAARTALTDAGYEVHVNEGKEWSNDVARDHVLRTDPKPGSQLATGKTVTLTLSRGKQTWTVPQVRGRTFGAATSALKAVGDFTVRATPTQRYDDKIAKGRVITTSPAAGAVIASDVPLTIVVSQGPPEVAVPRIAAGTSRSDAVDELEAADFDVRVTERFDDSIGAGNVISVSPDDRALKFSTVNLTVSLGPEMVAVPRVVGQPLAKAQQAIRDANLVPDVSKVPGPNGDTVVLQSPNGTGGDKLRAGSTVTLYVFGI